MAAASRRARGAATTTAPTRKRYGTVSGSKSNDFDNWLYGQACGHSENSTNWPERERSYGVSTERYAESGFLGHHTPAQVPPPASPAQVPRPASMQSYSTKKDLAPNREGGRGWILIAMIMIGFALGVFVAVTLGPLHSILWSEAAKEPTESTDGAGDLDDGRDDGATRSSISAASVAGARRVANISLPDGTTGRLAYAYGVQVGDKVRRLRLTADQRITLIVGPANEGGLPLPPSAAAYMSSPRLSPSGSCGYQPPELGPSWVAT
jgi:hypothetical protein